MLAQAALPQTRTYFASRKRAHYRSSEIDFHMEIILALSKFCSYVAYMPAFYRNEKIRREE